MDKTLTEQRKENVPQYKCPHGIEFKRNILDEYDTPVRVNFLLFAEKECIPKDLQTSRKASVKKNAAPLMQSDAGSNEHFMKAGSM